MFEVSILNFFLLLLFIYIKKKADLLQWLYLIGLTKSNDKSSIGIVIIIYNIII